MFESKELKACISSMIIANTSISAPSHSGSEQPLTSKSLDTVKLTHRNALHCKGR